MNTNNTELQNELLKDKRVVEEINRHLWIESEKAGHDIGFENATRDWMTRFSQTWLDYHAPESKKKSSGGSRASSAGASLKNIGKIFKSKKS